MNETQDLQREVFEPILDAIKEKLFQEEEEPQKEHWAGIDCSIKVSREVRRNDPCPCGSGKKAKHCCGAFKKHIPYNIH